MFDINLDSTDLFGDVANVVGATAVLIKTGFSTRVIVCDSSFVSYITTRPVTQEYGPTSPLASI